MKRRFVIRLSFLAATLWTGITGCGERTHSQPASEGAEVSVAMEGLHALATPEGATVGAIFGTFTPDADDTLLSVSVPASVAARAEVHEMYTDSLGQRGMRRVGALALVEHEPLVFEPGGRHIMLIDLAAPLRTEHGITLRLRFARGGERVVEVPVSEP